MRKVTRGRLLDYIPVGLVVILFVSFIHYLVFAQSWIVYPHSIDFGEGFVLNYARLWSIGAWNWDITTPPYMTMVYGVGYPIMMQPLINIFGAELWLGRLVSVVSALVVCLMLYFIVKEITGRKLYGLIAAMLPATQPIFRDWSVMARVDMPAVMFDMIGFYIALKFRDSKWLYCAVIPFFVAAMIKLTAVSGLIAVVLYLLIYNRKRLLLFLVSFIAIFGVAFAYLMVITNGLYWQHVFLYQNTIQNFDIPIMMVNFQMFFPAFIPLFFLAMVYLRRYLNKKRITIVGLFFIVAFVTNIVATLRPGAAGMYYFETIIAGCLCFALIFHYLSQKKNHQFMIITVVMVVLFLGIYGLRTNMRIPDERYDRDLKVVASMISDTDKPIVTENSAIVLHSGKELYIETFIFTNLARLGYWNDEPYVNQFRNQYFDYVLLKVSIEQKKKYEAQGYPDSNFTTETMKAIQDNYTLVYTNESPDAYNNPDKDWRCFLNLYKANSKL